MKAYFYKMNIPQFDKSGRPLEPRKDVLCFHMERASMADVKAEPFIFDGPATDRHIQEYPVQYQDYLEFEGLTDSASKPTETLVVHENGAPVSKEFLKVPKDESVTPNDARDHKDADVVQEDKTNEVITEDESSGSLDEEYEKKRSKK